MKSRSIAFDEARIEPSRGALVFRDADEARREESSGGLKEQVEPRLSFVEGPDFELMRELS